LPNPRLFAHPRPASQMKPRGQAGLHARQAFWFKPLAHRPQPRNPRGTVRRLLPPLRPPQENTNGPTHRLTLVGHRPECLHSCQYFVESLGGTRTLNCECAHGMPHRRMCGGTSIRNLMIRLRIHLDHRPNRPAVESPCRFCWFGYWERGAVISIEFQAVERKGHQAERTACNGTFHQI
jgi:hypothetical protein